LYGAFLRFFAPALETGQLRSFLPAFRRLLFLSSLVLSAVAVAALVGLPLAGQQAWVSLAAIGFVFSLFSGYSAVLDSVQNAARQRVIVAWHDGLAPWLRFGLAVALVAAFGTHSWLAMAGYALAALIVLASQFLFFRRKIVSLSAAQAAPRIALVNDWSQQMWHYAWPFALWGIFTWAQMASDRWSLQAFSGARNVGLYAVLYQLGYYPIVLVTNLVMQLVTPVVFSRAGDGSDIKRLRTTRQLNYRLVLGSLGLTGLATGMALLVHRPLFALLVAPSYQAASWMLPGLVLSGGLFAAGQIASLALMTDIRSRELIFPKIATALLGILLNALGASRLGLPGVVLASLGFSAAYLAWILILLGHPTARVVSPATSGHAP
jgi:O-antigen/teichoic acid export membrane protein